MNLRIGLSAGSCLWTQALDQEKVPYRLLASPLSLETLSEDPVVILAHKPAQTELGTWRSYLEHDGAMVTTPETAAALGQSRNQKIFFVEDPAFIEKDLGVPCEKKFELGGGRFVTEVVALRPMGDWRRRLTASLKAAFWSQGLPYVRLNPYPAPYEGVFSFRMDLDNHIERDFGVFCDIVRGHEKAVSCFVSMRSYAGEKKALQKLGQLGVEIGSHGYIHHVYDRLDQNLWNIEEAENLLKPHAESFEGFVAPHGRWHPTLQKALEARGYGYSSEFTLNYDDLPFFPRLNGKPSAVLQLPVHPICEGVFMERHGYDEKMLSDYFERVVSLKRAQGEPVLIFGHPDGRIGAHPEIFRNLMALASGDRALWKTNFGSWARWWKERAAWTFDAVFEKEVRVTRFPEDPRAKLQIFMPNTGTGTSAVIIPEMPVRHSLFKRLKLRIKEWLDWETKTPLSCYLILSPRDGLRYFLRFVTGKR